MIKPMACPWCRKEPHVVKHRQQYEIICPNIRCGYVVLMIGKTKIGAILRWNWLCFWERMRRKAK